LSAPRLFETPAPDWYVACPVHRLWHDVAQPCFRCVCDAADAATLPEGRLDGGDVATGLLGAVQEVSADA